MNKVKKLAQCLALGLLLALPTQAQNIVWKKSLGVPGFSFQPRGSAVAADGNIWVTGWFEQEYFKNPDIKKQLPKAWQKQSLYGRRMFVYKLSPKGDSLWCKLYPTAVQGISIVSTKDGGCAVAAFVKDYREKLYPNDRTQGVKVLKLDKDGAIVWQQIYKASYNSTPDKIIASDDAYFVIADKPASTTQSPPKMMTRLLKIDLQGKQVWEKIIGSDYITANDLTLCDNGDLLLVGDINYRKYGAMRLKPQGEVVWHKEIPITANLRWASMHSVQAISNKEFILSGNSSGRSYLIKIDAQGKMLWFKVKPEDHLYKKTGAFTIGKHYLLVYPKKRGVKMSLYDQTGRLAKNSILHDGRYEIVQGHTLAQQQALVVSKHRKRFKGDNNYYIELTLLDSKSTPLIKYNGVLLLSNKVSSI
jgi:outer membrane protein assembly factor BamB